MWPASLWSGPDKTKEARNAVTRQTARWISLKGSAPVAFCIRRLRGSASGHRARQLEQDRAAVGRAPAPPDALTSRTRQRQTRNGAPEEEAPERRERRAAASRSQTQHAATRIGRHQPKVTRHGGRGTRFFPCLSASASASPSRSRSRSSASPSPLSFPLALRLHQLEPLPSFHPPPDLPSLLRLHLHLAPSRQAGTSRASGRNARAEAPAPVVRLARRRRARRGGSWRRRGRPRQADDDERSGGAGWRAAAGQGPAPRYCWAFFPRRARGPPARVIVSRRDAPCAYASRGAAASVCMGVAERVLV